MQEAGEQGVVYLLLVRIFHPAIFHILLFIVFLCSSASCKPHTLVFLGSDPPFIHALPAQLPAAEQLQTSPLTPTSNIFTTLYHFRNIDKLHPTLTLADTEKLVHAFISSMLDYCKAILIRIPGKSLHRLKYIWQHRQDPVEGAQTWPHHPYSEISSLAHCPHSQLSKRQPLHQWSCRTPVFRNSLPPRTLLLF